jgi:membrane protein
MRRVTNEIGALVQRAEQATVDFLDRGPARRGFYSLWKGMALHNAGRVASAMAFNLFLAAIPMLALGGYLAATLLRQSQDALDLMSLYMDLSPLEVHQIVQRHFKRFSGGAVAPVAILGSLWLASNAFYMLMSVFERAVRAAPRAWWKKRLIAIACVLATNLIFAATTVAAVAITGGPSKLLSFLRTGDELVGPLERAVSIGVALLGATGALALFFRVAVNRPGLNRRIWPGAVATVALGGLASSAFAVYASSIQSFAVFYGSLAAVAIALAWLWIWCAALLLGAELNAQLEGGDRIAPPSTVRMAMRARRNA